MILTMQREPSKDGATLSKLYMGNLFICDILEDVIREEKGVPVAKWKQKGRTAIPAGKYRLALENSNRFGPDTLTVKDVPGFEYIRIHAGNTSEDTEGCLLPGMRANKNTVVNSRVALSRIRNFTVNLIKAGEPVFIEILNPLMTA